MVIGTLIVNVVTQVPHMIYDVPLYVCVPLCIQL